MLGDKTIINILKNDDRQGFNEIFDSYYPRMYAYALRYVSNKNDAEDIVISTLAHIWETRAKINITSSVASYFFRCVHNRCIDHLKRINKEQKNRVFINREEFENSYDLEYNVEDVLLNKELGEHLKNNISELPEQCRKVFVLSKLEGLSQKKIAKELNITVNTVETQMSRALKKLRNGLSKYIRLFLLFSVAEFIKYAVFLL